jgi:hypothetical protein
MPPPPSGIAEHYALKALLERVLGHESFMRVKEYAPLSAWRAECTRLLKAIRVAVTSTVDIADATWRDEVEQLLARGIQRVRMAATVGELHAVLAATLGELCFLQLGDIPQRSLARKSAPLTAAHWRLTAFRSVQYVQTPEQAARVNSKLPQSE